MAPFPLAAGKAAGAQFLAEASVGAGLPVLSTLRDLVETGDTVTRIEVGAARAAAFKVTRRCCVTAQGEEE